MDKEDKTDREKRYLERQRKELDKQREQLLKQIQERKEQSRISIQMEMRKTSTPKTKDTEKQIHKDTQIHIHNPVVLDSSKHKTGQSAMRKESEKMEESHVSIAQEMETHSQYLGSLDSDSLGYGEIDKGGSYHKDASEASYGIARLLADIDRYKDANPVTNVLDGGDTQQVSTPSVSIMQEDKDKDKETNANKMQTERRTVVSDKARQVNTHTKVNIQTDRSPLTDVTDRDALQVSTHAVPVTHTKVDIGHELGSEQLPYMQKAHNEHIGQTVQRGTIDNTPSMDESLTHSMSGTDDDEHVIPLTQTVPMQRSHDKTLDQSIELLRTSLRSPPKYVKDGSQVSQTDIMEETDKDRRGNTLKHYDMTDAHPEKEEATNKKKIQRNRMYKRTVTKQV